MGREVEITQDNFEQEVAKSDIPVLLDFWAEWCMPCKMVAPVLEELSEEYADRLKVGKIDVDAHGELAISHNIQSIPSLVLYKAGEVVAQKVGAVPRADIEALFTPHLD